MYQTTDFGIIWFDVSTGFPTASKADFITPSSSNLYVLQRGDLWKRSLSEFGITGIEQTKLYQNKYPLYQRNKNLIIENLESG